MINICTYTAGEGGGLQAGGEGEGLQTDDSLQMSDDLQMNDSLHKKECTIVL